MSLRIGYRQNKRRKWLWPYQHRYIVWQSYKYGYIIDLKSKEKKKKKKKEKKRKEWVAIVFWKSKTGSYVMREYLENGEYLKASQLPYSSLLSDFQETAR